jgi:hypothetical protein
MTNGKENAQGARFIASNRYADGFVSTVTCVVIEAERPSTFTWTVLDDPGRSWTIRNMTTTIGAMVSAETAIGATR